MGQRAVYGFKNDNKATLTTVQWATQVPAIMQLVLDNTPSEDHENVLTQIFSEIAKFDHISALELYNADQLKNAYNSKDVGVHFTHEDTDYTLAIAISSNGSPKTLFTNDKEVSELVKNHPHAQDGFSMWFDKNTGEFQVWIDDFYLDNDNTFCGHEKISTHV